MRRDKNFYHEGHKEHEGEKTFDLFFFVTVVPFVFNFLSSHP